MKPVSARISKYIKILSPILLLIAAVFIAGCVGQPNNTGKGGSLEVPEVGLSKKVGEIEKPPLEKIPSTNVNDKPLAISYYRTLSGEVGKPFEKQYIGINGLAPYHFQLETGVGFPPMGVILDTNGKLSGTPSAAGTFTFGVCVVDTAGKSVCSKTVMTVKAAEVNLQIDLTKKSCVLDPKDPILLDGFYRAEAYGTASGPVGVTLYVLDPALSCDSWTASKGGECVRGPNDPEQTNWHKWNMILNTDGGYESVELFLNFRSKKTLDIRCP